MGLYNNNNSGLTEDKPPHQPMPLAFSTWHNEVSQTPDSRLTVVKFSQTEHQTVCNDPANT